LPALPSVVAAATELATQAGQSYGTPSFFVMFETTGQQRVISLGGRALPYRPFEVSGDMRIETTWYPGNPIGTLQVLGASEGQTTITGMWKDRFISTAPGLTGFVSAVSSAIQGNQNALQPDGYAALNGAQVADVSTLAQIIDDIRRQGQLLEVRWDKLIRRGVMTRFVQKWLRHQDLEYEITFQWISQGDPTPPVVLSQEPDRASLVANLQAAYNTLFSAYDPDFPLTEAFQKSAGGAVASINAAVQDMANNEVNYTNSAVNPLQAAQRALAALQDIQTGANDIVAACEAQPGRAIIQLPNNSSGYPNLTLVSYGLALDAAEYLRQLILAAQQMATLAAYNGQQLQARVQDTELIGVFVARQGQDLRDVSTTYYGTQDEWVRLAQYNGQAQSACIQGQTYYVPKLRPTDAGGASGGIG
jgi:hypothetical protein